MLLICLDLTLSIEMCRNIDQYQPYWFEGQTMLFVREYRQHLCGRFITVKRAQNGSYERNLGHGILHYMHDKNYGRATVLRP